MSLRTGSRMPQVRDDPALLARLVAEEAAADPLYQPTAYWRDANRALVAELQRIGLHDFRRRRQGSVLSDFGATDLAFSVQLEGWGRLGPLVQRLLARLGFGFTVDGLDAEAVTQLCYRVLCARMAGWTVPWMSLYGNPEDVAIRDGQPYSRAHLQTCALVADALVYVSLPPSGVFVELGAGLGRTVEILAQRYPRMTFVLFDLAPQLYVAHQYLQAVFGDRVVLAGGARPGSIVCYGAWMLPHFIQACQTKALPIDVFWTSASLQETTPVVAANYLRLVQALSPRLIYLNLRPEGKATDPPLTAASLLVQLDPAYHVRAAYLTDRLVTTSDYRSYVLTRQEAGQ